MTETVLKLAGCGLILLGCAWFGLRYRNALLRRTAVTENMLQTLRMIREKVEKENEVLEVGMQSSGALYPIPEGNLFSQFADEGRDAETENLAAAWETHIHRYFARNDLTDGTVESALCELGKAFAHLSTESLTAAMQVTLSALQEGVETAKEKARKEGPFVLKAALLAGAFLVILLW